MFAASQRDQAIKQRVDAKASFQSEEAYAEDQYNIVKKQVVTEREAAHAQHRRAEKLREHGESEAAALQQSQYLLESRVAHLLEVNAEHVYENELYAAAAELKSAEMAAADAGLLPSSEASECENDEELDTARIPPEAPTTCGVPDSYTISTPVRNLGASAAAHPRDAWTGQDLLLPPPGLAYRSAL